MTSLRNTLFLIFAAQFSSPLFAQVFGGNPPSVKWRQVNTPASRIIFPAGIDSTAERVSNIISYIRNEQDGKSTKKINIVLQNQTTISNGYVSLGPYRSEFYLTPPQNSFSIGSIPWADYLTIHEYRHAEQYSDFNVGLSKTMRVLFGEQGQALANAAAIPNWFFEGDAIYAETNYSKQGRGSLPSFYNDYRALWKENKNYSWMKLRNGSFKDFVPDHYALGYLLVAYGYEKYGNHFWEKVTHDAAAYKHLFYPFQHALKKHSGVNYSIFRKNATEFFKAQFEDKKNVRPAGNNENYRDEQYPVFTEDGQIIYVKSSFQQRAQFVIKDSAEINKIRTADNTIEPYFSYSNHKIVYASYQPDARWGYRNYSNLQLIDITSGDQYTITKRTKYFSPGINKDGSKIIAVNVPPSGNCQLHLLNVADGSILDPIPNPDQLFYTYPKFYNEDSIIAVVRDTEGKMSLALISLSGHPTQYLLPFTYNVIAYPLIQHDTLYFSYSYNKNDELFAYTFQNKKLWKLSSPNEWGLGKYQVAASETDLVWSTFTASGYRLKKIPKNELKFDETGIDGIQKNTSSFGINSLNNIHANLLYKVEDEPVKITKYPKSFHLFNFHSLQPAIDDPQYTLTLLSENILNTLQSNLSITYDRAEKFKRLGFDATYGSLFPFISAGVNYTFDRKITRNQNPVYFNELEPYAGFNIPLNLSKGKSLTYLNAGSKFVYNQSNFQGKYKDSFNTVSYSYLNNFINFSHQILKAKQQIFPRFAQSVNLSLKNALTNYNGYQAMAKGNLYFPGLINNHSLVLNGAHLQKDSTGQINFSSGFPFSRGYQSANFYQMSKWGVDYHFPLCYPDVGFANIFYLLRIRANIFYDDTKVNDFHTNGNAYHLEFRSAGTEIFFDTKWWNQAGIDFGFRYSRLLDPDLYGNKSSNRWEIILPVNILNK